MFERFAGATREAVRVSAEEASRRGDRRIGTDHLLLGLLHDSGSAGALGVSLDELWSGSPHPARAERLDLWRSLEDLASPEELAGLGRLLQILLVGYRAVAATAPRAGGAEESRER
jgi:hypothetical protein